MVVLVCTACQVFKVTYNPAFNYNAIYHCGNIIGIPILLMCVLFWVEYRDDFARLGGFESDGYV